MTDDGFDAAEDALLRRIRRALAEADRFAAKPRLDGTLDEGDRRFVIGLMADLALAAAALGRLTGELDRRIAGIDAGLRAASSYQRALQLNRPGRSRR